MNTAGHESSFVTPQGTRYALKTANPTPELLQRRLKSGGYRYDNDGQLEKRCSHCSEYWPADSEFFYPAKPQGDGLHTWCKACYQEWKHEKGRHHA